MGRVRLSPGARRVLARVSHPVSSVMALSLPRLLFWYQEPGYPGTATIRKPWQSPAFAKTWAGHDVAPPMIRVTSFRHPGVGTVRVTTTSFAVSVFPDARMVVCTAADEESRIALDKLAAGLGTDTHFPCWPTHQPERVAVLTGAGS